VFNDTMPLLNVIWNFSLLKLCCCHYYKRTISWNTVPKSQGQGLSVLKAKDI